MINRLAILTRRCFRAAGFGVCFTGSRYFRLPPFLRLRGQYVQFAAPDEVGLSWDFINLALDDDYGLRDFTSPLDTVLDVGANCGLFSLLASHYFPAAKIHAYEPNPRMFFYASKNLAQVGVTVFSAGIGSRSGWATLADYGESRLAQTTPGDNGAIPMVSLAKAIERLGGKVDLLKLDCEGAEWDIFQATDAFEKVRIIRMEYHLTSKNGMDELRTQAWRLGFRLDRLLEHGGYGIAGLSKSTASSGETIRHPDARAMRKRFSLFKDYP
jgi:FkbM family methyltransferase